MTFRNTALLFSVFLLLNSCKGLQYYKSGTNPAGVSVIMECPTTFFTNEDLNDSIQLYLINHNSNDIVLTNWLGDLWLIGQSRFYKKEITIPVSSYMDAKIVSNFKSNDTVYLGSVALKKILGSEKNWIYKSKNVLGPHLISAKKYYPYIFLTAELNTKVPNQADIIKIRSNDQKVVITQSSTPSLKNKKTVLSLTSDTKQFDIKSKSGNLLINISNTSSYPIPMFNDPGSVRFKIYAYNANRTAVMFTQFVLDNGKLPFSPINIEVNGNYNLSVPLEQLLFTQAPSKPVYFWSWNKKSPPISPLVYGKKDIAMDVEFWFGVVVDGKEYLSNTLMINVGTDQKKTNKKRK